MDRRVSRMVPTVPLYPVPRFPVIKILHMILHICHNEPMLIYYHQLKSMLYLNFKIYFFNRTFPLETGHYNPMEKYFTLKCVDFYLNCSFYLMHFTANSEHRRDRRPADRTPVWRNVFTEKCVLALSMP